MTTWCRNMLLHFTTFYRTQRITLVKVFSNINYSLSYNYIAGQILPVPNPTFLALHSSVNILDMSLLRICFLGMAESEEELKSLLMKVREESEKTGIKFNIQEFNIHSSLHGK